MDRGDCAGWGGALKHARSFRPTGRFRPNKVGFEQFPESITREQHRHRRTFSSDAERCSITHPEPRARSDADSKQYESRFCSLLANAGQTFTTASCPPEWFQRRRWR